MSSQFHLGGIYNLQVSSLCSFLRCAIWFKDANLPFSFWRQSTVSKRGFVETRLVKSVTTGHHLQLRSWELRELKRICCPGMGSLCNKARRRLLLMGYTPHVSALTCWQEGHMCYTLFSHTISLSTVGDALSYFPHVTGVNRTRSSSGSPQREKEYKSIAKISYPTAARKHLTDLGRRTSLSFLTVVMFSSHIEKPLPFSCHISLNT